MRGAHIPATGTNPKINRELRRCDLTKLIFITLNGIFFRIPKKILSKKWIYSE
jgi:hypothetical protein